LWIKILAGEVFWVIQVPVASSLFGVLLVESPPFDPWHVTTEHAAQFNSGLIDRHVMDGGI
jgi:hypothetical protein